jgi:hypothetical protein
VWRESGVKGERVGSEEQDSRSCICVDEAMSVPQTALESPARMAACNWPHYEIASRG